MKKFIINFCMFGAFALALSVSSCKDEEKEEEALPVSDILLYPKNAIEIGIGETLQLDCVVFPVNAAQQTIDWSSDDATVVRVSNTGLLTSLAYGTTKIWAKATDGSNVMGSVSVTVKRPPALNVSGEYKLVGTGTSVAGTGNSTPNSDVTEAEFTLEYVNSTTITITGWTLFGNGASRAGYYTRATETVKVDADHKITGTISYQTRAADGTLSGTRYDTTLGTGTGSFYNPDTEKLTLRLSIFGGYTVQTVTLERKP
jgi:hypothetical protein